MVHVSRCSFLVALLLAASPLVACSGDDEPDTSKPASTSGTAPGSRGGSDAGAASDAGGGAPSEADLGPECTAYVACCEEVAAAQPALGASCDQVEASLASAQAQGRDALDRLESSCSSGLAGFRSAGFCK